MRIDVNLTLTLPRDHLGIPVARHIATNALAEVGVDGDCIADIELALTEACTNVLDHSAADDAYEVSISFDDEECVIGVVDCGHGFDYRSLRQAEPTDESGRGVALMRALVDTIEFDSDPQAGMIVNMRKRLVFDEGHPLRRAARERAQALAGRGSPRTAG